MVKQGRFEIDDERMPEGMSDEQRAHWNAMVEASNNNLRTFRRQAAESNGDLIIMSHEIVRLKQLIEDEPDDFYWEVEQWNGKTKWITGCEGMIQLRNVLPNDQYDRMARQWNRNHTEVSQCRLSDE